MCAVGVDAKGFVRVCARSLVTTLRAAEMFEVAHLSSDTVAPLVAGAELYYVEGFFLTHGVDAVLALSTHASEKHKVWGSLLVFRLHVSESRTRTLSMPNAIVPLRTHTAYTPP